MFNVIIAEPEEWSNYDLLVEKCNYYLSNRIKSGEKIIALIPEESRLSEKYAMSCGFDIRKFSLNWKEFGKDANYVRSSLMTDLSNACIVFSSSYSANFLEKSLDKCAKRKNLMIRIVKDDDE